MTRYKCKALRKTVKTRDLIIMTPPKNRHSTKFNFLKIKMAFTFYEREEVSPSLPRSWVIVQQ